MTEEKEPLSLPERMAINMLRGLGFDPDQMKNMVLAYEGRWASVESDVTTLLSHVRMQQTDLNNIRFILQENKVMLDRIEKALGVMIDPAPDVSEPLLSEHPL